MKRILMYTVATLAVVFPLVFLSLDYFSDEISETALPFSPVLAEEGYNSFNIIQNKEVMVRKLWGRLPSKKHLPETPQ